MSQEWSWVNAEGKELRVMQLPERKSLYVILVDEFGMHAVARTLDDQAATMLVSWIDTATGGDGTP